MSIVMLAADTTRSQAYAQALAAQGVDIEAALIVRSPERGRWGQASEPVAGGGRAGGVALVDLAIPLATSLDLIASDVAVLDTGTVNCAEVVEWLVDLGPDLVIYSGFGGELVGESILALDSPLLHVHSGWLPEYRGSTTMYYSALRDGSCAASALLLESDIDAGPVVARRRYPLPPPRVDIDHVYDSSIRADLLGDVVLGWLTAGGRFTETMAQPESGTTYYIIHPVLKHLAIDRINRTNA